MDARVPRFSDSGTVFLKLFMKTDLYTGLYVPRGDRPLTAEEAETRRIAQDLKIPTAESIEFAAPLMAALIDGPCWLIPVPASNMTVTANLALAQAIARPIEGARVSCAIARKHAVESSRVRQFRGERRLTLEDHGFIRVGGPLRALPAYFVDNVITTGTTITACRRALGWGTGLAFALVNKPHRASSSRAWHGLPGSMVLRERSAAAPLMTIRVARVI